MRAILLLLLCALMGTGLEPMQAVAGEPEAPTVAGPINKAPASEMVRANNEVARALFGAVYATPGNQFLSPYSIHAALLMVREGAGGESANEIDTAARFERPRPRRRVHRFARDADSAIGIERVFDAGRAEFGTVRAKERLFIGAAYHQGFVAVDEKGTEAAAATILSGDAGESLPPRTASFKADRPFFFLVRHASSGAIVFIGRLNTPGGGKAPLARKRPSAHVLFPATHV